MNDSCASRGCISPCQHAHGFCAECAEKIFKSVTSHIDDVLKVASSLYFGRSSHPERRLLEHFLNKDRNHTHMLVMHWAANWPEIRYFEESLIDFFTKDAKYLRIENDSGRSDGKLSGAWHALYVSFSLKSGCHIPGAIVVKQLHWRNRLWPNPLLPNAPVLLRCGLSNTQAYAEHARFESTKDARWAKR
jgi:hypothetical protein